MGQKQWTTPREYLKTGLVVFYRPCEHSLKIIEVFEPMSIPTTLLVRCNTFTIIDMIWKQIKSEFSTCVESVKKNNFKIRK